MGEARRRLRTLYPQPESDWLLVRRYLEDVRIDKDSAVSICGRATTHADSR
jgi:hypothetical protein